MPVAGRPLQGGISYGSRHRDRRDLRHQRQTARGNSGFAFIGSYSSKGEEIHVKVSTQRHNHDPALKPLFGTDMITLALKGTADGDMVDFEGTALQLPGVAFKAVLTRIGD
jgi:hypothetical protein